MEGVLDWFWSLPPLTRTWFAASLAVHGATTLDVLRPADLIFSAHRIIYNLELWRMATSFLYAGGDLHQFHVLISLYMITLHSASYERNPYFTGGNPRADYFFCLLFCITITLMTFLGLEYFYQYYYGHKQRLLVPPLFARTLLTCISYLWSRRNPNAIIQLNFIPMQGRYLPFCQMALSWGLGNSIAEMVHGILVGHVYFYLVEVVPSLIGRHILHTPAIFVQVLDEVLGAQPEFRQDAADGDGQRQQQQQQDPRRRFLQEGATEAHIAAKTGNLEKLQQLAETAEGRQSLAAKDNNDWQPLHEAVRGGYLDIINFLLSYPEVLSDINARTAAGNGPNPLAIAESTHGANHPVARRLQELGAIHPVDRGGGERR